jgi:hypothetical protein
MSTPMIPIPKHQRIGLTVDGNGPAFGDNFHHWGCWCSDPDCTEWQTDEETTMTDRDKFDLTPPPITERVNEVPNPAPAYQFSRIPVILRGNPMPHEIIEAQQTEQGQKFGVLILPEEEPQYFDGTVPEGGIVSDTWTGETEPEDEAPEDWEVLAQEWREYVAERVRYLGHLSLDADTLTTVANVLLGSPFNVATDLRPSPWDEPVIKATVEVPAVATDEPFHLTVEDIGRIAEVANEAGPDGAVQVRVDALRELVRLALEGAADERVTDQEEHTHYTPRSRAICAGGDHDSAVMWDRDLERIKVRRAQEEREAVIRQLSSQTEEHIAATYGVEHQDLTEESAFSPDLHEWHDKVRDEYGWGEEGEGETTQAEEPIEDRLRRAFLNGFKEGVDRAASSVESWGRWDS